MSLKDDEYLSIDQRLEGILSPLIHYGFYKLRKPEMQLAKSMLITSVDIDVGNKMLGVLNRGKYDANFRGKSANLSSEYTVGKTEEQALPLIMNFFNEMQIPVTFAIRGQLLEVEDTILDTIFGSSVKHEIASHSYYHSDFTKLRHDEADNELELFSEKMKHLRINPRSFIFPRNRVAHLDLLEKYGYKCYRGYGTSHPYFIYEGMYIKKHGHLYDVHPSLYIGSCAHTRNVRLIERMIAISVEKRLPFHIWFHPWNLGIHRKSILARIRNVFFPLFSYAKFEERKGALTIETMISAVEKVEELQS